MKKLFFAILFFVLGVSSVNAQQVDYTYNAPEERGIDFMQITQASDYVCMPIVQRTRKGVSWYANRVIDVSSDNKIAYISVRNNTSNIFIKDLNMQGGAVQRTNRQAVNDFSYSPDGKQIVFSETRGNSKQIFITDANVGYTCRQVTNANQDYSPIYTSDQSEILFARDEGYGTTIWCYNVKSNFLSTYSSGMNPYPLHNAKGFLCTRIGENGRGEIWKINTNTGVEECVVTSPESSFSSPVLSPNGEWVLFVGLSTIQTDTEVYQHTDLYVCRIDGTGLERLTYHPADELSPTWSRDGKFIYFISQRGNAAGTANIWRMPFMF